MRRAVSSIMVALGLLGVTVASGGVALAAPAAASLPSAAPGKKRCTIADERLRELSGLVATRSGYIVINDGTDVESRKRIFFLDSKCKVAKVVGYSGGGPFDTEDLALSPNAKTLWIADTGDNVTAEVRRERVAVWTMPVTGAKQPVLHRLTYPEKKPHDAEALLIGGDGRPLIITKVPNGKAQIFRPTAALKKNGDTEPVPMEKVGEIALPKTDTDNRMSVFGRVAITGAARSPDGTRVVLRTYADAFEYDVQNGDVLAALTKGTPKVTALADPFGEAIAYTPDGKTFLTVSDGGQMEEGEPLEILAYTPSTEGAKPVSGEGGGEQKKAGQSWFDALSLQDITYLIAAVGAVGALLVGAGIVGILRARRRSAGRPGDDADGRDSDDDLLDDRRVRPDDGFPEPDAPRGGGYGGAADGGVYGGGRGGAPAGGGVYGGGRPAGGGGGGGVYGGGRPADGGGGVYGGGRPNGGRPAGGGVYGGQPAGGGVYGGGRAEPPRRGGPDPDPRGPRAGRRRDGGFDDGRGSYGQAPGRSYRGDRY
ncbi:hypothetical protein ACVCAH_08535 [Micromonospora sp. LZ34]